MHSSLLPKIYKFLDLGPVFIKWWAGGINYLYLEVGINGKKTMYVGIPNFLRNGLLVANIAYNQPLSVCLSVCPSVRPSVTKIKKIIGN